MSTDQTPYAVSAEPGMFSKLSAWMGKNKPMSFIIFIAVICIILWWATDKGYMEGISLPFKIGRKNPRGYESDSDSDSDSDELDEDIDDIVTTQQDLWDEKLQKDELE
jgi:hypothetical protein